MQTAQNKRGLHSATLIKRNYWRNRMTKSDVSFLPRLFP